MDLTKIFTDLKKDLTDVTKFTVKTLQDTFVQQQTFNQKIQQIDLNMLKQKQKNNQAFTKMELVAWQRYQNKRYNDGLRLQYLRHKTKTKIELDALKDRQAQLFQAGQDLTDAEKKRMKDLKKILDDMSKDERKKNKEQERRDKERRIENIKVGKETVNKMLEPIKNFKDKFGTIIDILGLFIGLKIFKAFLNTEIGEGYLKSVISVLNFFSDLGDWWNSGPWDSEKGFWENISDILSDPTELFSWIGDGIALIGTKFYDAFKVASPFIIYGGLKMLGKKFATRMMDLVYEGIGTNVRRTARRFRTPRNRAATLKRGLRMLRVLPSPSAVGGGIKGGIKRGASKALIKTAGGLSSLLGVFSGIGNIFPSGAGKGGGIMKFFKGPGFKVFKKIATKGLYAVPVLGQVIMVIEGLFGAYEAGMKEYEDGGSMGDIISASLGGILDGLLGWIVDLGAWLAGLFGFEEVEKTLDEFSFAEVFKEMWQAIKKWFSGADSETPKESWFDIMIQTLKDFFSTIGDKIEQMGISLFAGDLKDKYDAMKESFMEFITSVRNIGTPQAKELANAGTKKVYAVDQGKTKKAHDGGFVQDVPMILQSGEYVVSRRGVQAAMANGGRVPQLDLGGTGRTGSTGTPPIINNIVNNNSSSNVSNLSNTVARPFSELYTAFTG